MENSTLQLNFERRIYTVQELTHAIQGLLEREFTDIWVAGEISGARRWTSGHWYFTLKDLDAQIQCVVWKRTARLLRFQPQDGIAVLVRGRVDVYPQRGQYQLVVEALEPKGYGALQLAFEQLKEKLATEGLFDGERKRPLPPFPRRVGIVTSPSGAAIRDMIHVLTRRFPGVHIRLYPAQVQGEGSAAEVVEGISYLALSGWPEVIIVGRGGGSLEDLWTFNEEDVARTIGASPVPVVSAVGHETDFTIADFVADLRAPTPSAAAELVVPERREVLERIASASGKMERAVGYRVVEARGKLHERGVDRAAGLLRRRIGRQLQQVDDGDYGLRELVRERVGRGRRLWQGLDARLRRRDVRLHLAEVRRRLESAQTSAWERMRSRLVRDNARLTPLAAELHQLSPLRVLERGYATFQDGAGNVVKDAALAPAGTRLGVRLHRGRLSVEVTDSSVD